MPHAALSPHRARPAGADGSGLHAVPGSHSAAPASERAVIGYVTEIEHGNLSLRTVDGRSLHFSLRRSPVPAAELELDMAARNPVKIAYRPGTGRLLVPLTIEEPCPGPECPPPYSQPPPSAL